MTNLPLDTMQVRRHFSSHADEYDRYAQVQKRVVAGLLHRLPHDLPTGGIVLDLGSGTGDLARKFYERTPHLQLIVADIAHAMTRTAASRIPGVHAVDADAESIPLAERSIDLVLSASMYQWVNDLPHAFAEVARVLKPGGIFAFALFGAETLCELRDSHAAALCAEEKTFTSHMQSFPDLQSVTTALQSAGLPSRTESCFEKEYHPDVADLLRHLKRIGAQNASANRPQGLSGRRTTERMMSIYRDRYGENGVIPATYEVIYGVVVKTY